MSVVNIAFDLYNFGWVPSIMADSSDSEEFVSADEGPVEDFHPTAAR